MVPVVEVHEKIKEVEVIREVFVPQVEIKEVERIVYVDRPVPIIEIQERIKTIEVKVPEIIIQEVEKIKVVEIPTQDKIEVLKPYEIVNQVPLIETKIKEVETVKYIDNPITLIERVEIPKEIERIVNVEKMVPVLEKVEVLKEVERNNYIDKLEVSQNYTEIVKVVEVPKIVKEKEVEIKEVIVEVPHYVTEYVEVILNFYYPFIIRLKDFLLN